MNKWRIYVAGMKYEVEGKGDWQTLRDMGIFGKIEQVDYFQTFATDDLWIYQVELNGKTTTAVIKRIENESRQN